MGRGLEIAPALLARWPQLLRETLRGYGIGVRTLALQGEGSNRALPITTGPLLVDLRGWTLADAAFILGLLRAQQRRTPLLLYILVPHRAIGYQRLIDATHGLPALILDVDQPDVLVGWLGTRLDLLVDQVWIGLTAPLAITRRPYLTQLVAHMRNAMSIGAVAEACALAPSTVYALLHDSCGSLPTSVRRTPQRWYSLLSMALVDTRPHEQQRELSGRYQPIGPTIRAVQQALVAEVIEQAGFDDHGARVVCAARDTQRISVSVELPGGCVVTAPSDLQVLPRWERVVEWVDSQAGTQLTIGLVGGIVLKLQGARSLVCRTAPHIHTL
jgi:hypothetical protein